MYTQQEQSRLYVYGGQGENALLGLFLYEFVGIHLPLLAEQPKTNETVILPKASRGPVGVVSLVTEHGCHSHQKSYASTGGNFPRAAEIPVPFR